MGEEKSLKIAWDCKPTWRKIRTSLMRQLKGNFEACIDIKLSNSLRKEAKDL